MDTLKMMTSLVFDSETKTELAFRAGQEVGKWDKWTDATTDYVFTHMLRKTPKKVVEAVLDSIDHDRDIPYDVFRGRLRERIPQVRLQGEFQLPYKRAADSCEALAAGVIANVLKDEGVLDVYKDRRVNADGERVTTLMVRCNGINVKNSGKGIHAEPGKYLQRSLAHRTISKGLKAFMKSLSDQAFVNHSALDQDVLWRFYTLQDDWKKTEDKNGNPVQWNPDFKRKFFKRLSQDIEDMSDVPYYLSWFLDARLRVNPDASRRVGNRPHGKSAETNSICEAVGHDLNARGVECVKQQLYAARYERKSIARSNKLLRKKDYAPVTKDDLLAATSHKEMANLLTIKKCLESIERYKNGEPDNNLYGWDFTFSGGIMGGILLKSSEMMTAGNVYALQRIIDAHSRFLKLCKLVGMTRDDAKTLQMGVTHGQHIGSLVKAMADLGYDITADELLAALESVYGDAIGQIDHIADWGRVIARSNYNMFRWTMPDGEIATHKAYQEGVPCENYVVSATEKKGHNHYVDRMALPYKTNNFGHALHPKTVVLGKTEYTTKFHLRGLYADIVHSTDAYVLRCIVKAFRALGKTILVKHDNFYIHANDYDLLFATAQQVLSDILDSNLLMDILNEIAEKSPNPGVKAPQLALPDDVENKIKESPYFLMP